MESALSAGQWESVELDGMTLFYERSRDHWYVSVSGREAGVPLRRIGGMAAHGMMSAAGVRPPRRSETPGR